MEFLSGIKAGIPIMAGYLPLAFAYGVLATAWGLTPAATVAMSVFVYAGASQFLAIGLLAAEATLSTIVLSTFILNLRHVLMALTLSAGWRHFGRWRLVVAAAHLTDETFAVITAAPPEQQPPSSGWLYGLQLSAYLSWVAGSAAGAMLGHLAPEPAVYGLDFALPAMFLALMVLQITDRAKALAALAAVVIYRLSLLFCASHWAVLLAACLAGGLAAFWFAPKAADTGNNKSLHTNPSR